MRTLGKDVSPNVELVNDSEEVVMRIVMANSSSKKIRTFSPRYAL